MDLTYTQFVTVEGEQLLLLVVEPNWINPVSISYGFLTESEETLSGVRHKYPKRQAPMIGQSYMTTVGASDAETLRGAFGALGKRRVAIPVWPDLLPAADWADRIHRSQINLGFDLSGAGQIDNAVIQTGGSTPAGDWKVPLFVGYFEDLPDAAAFTDESADFRIKVIEDSPWVYHLQFAGRQESGFPWDPDWTTEPRESLRRYAKFDEAGDGRERLLQGTDQILRSQRAGFSLSGRDQVREFLAFFNEQRGGCYKFAAPVWFKPGSETPTAPHALPYAQLASDSIIVDWSSDRHVEFDLTIEQTIEESVELPARVEAFKIWSTYDPNQVLYLVDSDAPVAWDSKEWTPARIEIERPEESLEIQKDGFHFRAALPDVPLFNLWLQGEIDAAIWVEVFEIEIDQFQTTGYQIFKGRARQPKFRGKMVEWSASAFAGFLDRTLPRFNFSRTCQHALFGHGCSRRRPSQMDKSEWLSSGEIKAFQPSEIRLDLESVDFHFSVAPWTSGTNAPQDGSGNSTVGGGVGAYYLQTSTGQLWQRIRPSTQPWSWEHDDWFAGGWIQSGTGLEKQIRRVVRSRLFPSTSEVHLYLDRPFRTDLLLSSEFDFFPGCDGRYLTCRQKFQNGVNFGGQPFAPAYLQEAPQNFNPGGK